MYDTVKLSLKKKGKYWYYINEKAINKFGRSPVGPFIDDSTQIGNVLVVIHM